VLLRANRSRAVLSRTARYVFREPCALLSPPRCQTRVAVSKILMGVSPHTITRESVGAVRRFCNLSPTGLSPASPQDRCRSSPGLAPYLLPTNRTLTQLPAVALPLPPLGGLSATMAKFDFFGCRRGDPDGPSRTLGCGASVNLDLRPLRRLPAHVAIPGRSRPSRSCVIDSLFFGPANTINYEKPVVFPAHDRATFLDADSVWI